MRTKSIVIVFSERQVCLFAPISMCQKQRTKLIYAAYVEGGEGARCQNRFRVS